jgi:hypothetical protein
MLSPFFYPCDLCISISFGVCWAWSIENKGWLQGVFGVQRVAA